VSKINVKKRRKKNSMHGWLICFALIITFGIMGLSLAAFQEGIGFSGSFVTGNVSASFIDRPYFSNYHETFTADRGSDDQPVLKASQGDDSINIVLSNVLPGEQYELVYTVKNTGSVPIRFGCIVNNKDSGLAVINTLNEDILSPDFVLPGTIRIEILEKDNILEAVSYEFALELTYKLWNLEN
jgi:hypothetical protein